MRFFSGEQTMAKKIKWIVLALVLAGVGFFWWTCFSDQRLRVTGHEDTVAKRKADAVNGRFWNNDDLGRIRDHYQQPTSMNPFAGVGVPPWWLSAARKQAILDDIQFIIEKSGIPPKPKGI